MGTLWSQDLMLHASIIAEHANLGWPTPTQALRKLRSILHEKNMKCLWVTILYYIPVQSSYVCDHAASLRISVNADLSTALNCLAWDRKSIEQLRPTAPSKLQHYSFDYSATSAYITVHYTYGMLILPCVSRPCPTPLFWKHQLETNLLIISQH